MEQTPKQAREEILSYLEQGHHTWLPAYQRMNRAGGNNAELNRDFLATDLRMNRLLDELFAQNVIMGYEDGTLATT